MTNAPQAALHNGSQGALTQTKGQPIVAGALAFGVGFFIASAFPGLRQKARWHRRFKRLHNR